MTGIKRLRQPPKRKWGCHGCITADAEFDVDVDWSDQGAHLCIGCLQQMVNAAIGALMSKPVNP